MINDEEAYPCKQTKHKDYGRADSDVGSYHGHGLCCHQESDGPGG